MMIVKVTECSSLNTPLYLDKLLLILLESVEDSSGL